MRQHLFAAATLLININSFLYLASLYSASLIAMLIGRCCGLLRD
jgi:hypothetical protein